MKKIQKREKTTMTELPPTKPSKELLAYLAANPGLLIALEDVESGRARMRLHLRYGHKTTRQRW